MGNSNRSQREMIGNSKAPKVLKIKGYTWKKRSLGLFDYGFNDLNTDNIEIEDPR